MSTLTRTIKWSDFAPSGTAQWCNEWRKRYHISSFQEQQTDTDLIMLGHATPDQHIINSTDLNKCLSGIDCRKKRVIEFGGWRGAMANAVLSEHPLRAWTNYEISPSALFDRHCADSRYECVVYGDFLWQTPRPASGDIFTSSHAIEHITKEHLTLLFAWLPESIKWMYLCAPIPDSCEDNKWEDYGGTHILEIGWEQVLALLPDFAVKDSGPEFRWLERTATI